MVVFLWLTSLSVTVSRSFHVAVNDIILFFFMAELYSVVYMYIIYKYLLCIYMEHSSVSGHLCCFHILAIINSVTVNIGVHSSWWLFYFPNLYLKIWFFSNVLYIIDIVLFSFLKLNYELLSWRKYVYIHAVMFIHAHTKIYVYV